MGKKNRLLDEYRFPPVCRDSGTGRGFRPRAEIKGIFGDQKALVIRLIRTQKKQYAVFAALFIGVITTRRFGGYETYPVEMQGSIWKWKFGVFYAEGVGK